MGLDFIAIVSLFPSSYASYLFLDLGSTFSVGSYGLFCRSAVSCDSEVFVRKGELLSFYSTVLPSNPH